MVNFMFHLNKIMVPKIFSPLIVLILFFTHNSLQAATLNAYVDNNVVQMGQFIQFSVKLTGKTPSGEPDFSPLKQDFDILSSTSKSSETRIVNGQMSSSSTWTITIAPKNDGAIVIPPITFAGTKTAPITIVVGKAPDADLSDVFFETEISSESVYVQAQVILTTKLYIKVLDISNVQLDELKINDALVLPQGEPLQSQIVKNGIRYYLIEQRHFIFPEKSGSLTIPALNFSAIVNDAASRFSRFGSKRRISAQSQSKTIEVKGVPKNYPDNALWLPAEELSLTETISPGIQTTLGEPITRTIITQAKGLPATTLPPAKLENIPDLKIYPDQGSHEDEKNNTFIKGTRKDAFALLPNRSGKIILPEYQVIWWDTKNNEIRYASLKAQELNILASDSDNNPGLLTQEGIHTNSDISDKNNPSFAMSANTGQTIPLFDSNKKLFIFIVIVFGFIWLSTLLFFFVYIRRLKNELLKTQTVHEHTNENIKSLLKDIEQAAKNKNLLQVRQSLITWGQVLFEDKQIKGLSELARHCQNETVTTSLKKIDANLFSENRSNKPAELDFDALLKQLSTISGNRDKSNQKSVFITKNGQKLADLYTV